MRACRVACHDLQQALFLAFISKSHIITRKSADIGVGYSEIIKLCTEGLGNEKPWRAKFYLRDRRAGYLC